MNEAFLNLFSFFYKNLYVPLNSAIEESGIFNSSSDFISKFLTAFFKLWNNENDFYFSGVDVINLFSEVLTIIILCLCLYAFLKIFMLFYRIITKGFSKVC